MKIRIAKKEDVLFYVVESENKIIGFFHSQFKYNVNCLADEATEFYKRYGFTKGKNFAWMDIALSEKFKRS